MKRTTFVLSILMVMVFGLEACSPSGLLKSLPAIGLGATTVPQAPAAIATATPGAPLVAPVPASSSSGILAAYQTTLEQIYEKVNPSVVNLAVTKKQTTGAKVPFDFFGQQPQAPGDQLQSGLGSGFVWDKEGYIVTNNHVIDQADQITVRTSDGTSYTGKLVGADKNSDLAVVKIEAPAGALTPVQVADSTQVKVGQVAVAIGNAFGLEGSMTVGIVSAVGRSLPVDSSIAGGPTYTIPDIIQTDAPINPGNSGGVLLNDLGQVIGVTAAIESPVRGSAGVGFVIPSAIVQKVVPVLIKNGKYQYAFLGITGVTISPEVAKEMKLDENRRGALIVAVTPGSPAEAAKLQGSDQTVKIDGRNVKIGGDVIIKIEGMPINKMDDLISYLVRATDVGQKITLTVLRQGKEITVDVILAARPEGEVDTGKIPENVKMGAALGITGLTMNPAVAAAMKLPETQKGVLIQDVAKAGAADNAGLKGSFKPVDIEGRSEMVGGDVIIGYEGKEITSMDDLRSAISQNNAGDEVALTILRDVEKMDVKVTLSAK